MLSFANMVDLFANEFARLGGGRFPFLLSFLCSFQSRFVVFLGHGIGLLTDSQKWMHSRSEEMA
jgi:hypothetical protein